MNQYILRKKNELEKRRASVRNGWILVVLLCITAVLAGFLFRSYWNRKVNRKFMKYYESITMEAEQIDDEIGTLIRFIENESISEENKAIASDMLSVMYGVNNNAYESMAYMCKALYYYDKINENASMMQMAVNLSATLISDTSYDMAEAILYRALKYELEPEEQPLYYMYIYTNLAESMSQRRNYDQAIEAVQLGESNLDLIDESYTEDCRLSLSLSKAIAYLGLGEVEKCEEIISGLDLEYIEKNLMNQITFGIPYCEVQSYIKLYKKNLKSSQKYFERYITYCDDYQYNSLKLFYIQKYTELAQNLGYNEISFTKKYEDNLIEMYREELQRSNNETARVLLDAYNISNENITIQARQRQTRLKIYGAIAVILALILIGSLIVARIRKSSQVDFLTGAFNRSKMRSVYRALLRRKQEFYVIMFDIDNFKKCNDVYGHRFGDTVLEQIAGTVRLILPKTSMFFRYGGEEFVVLCEMKTREELKELAELIRSSVEELTWETGTTITISMGVSTNINVADPIRTADECLYKSKNTGKNKVTYNFES